MAESSEMNRRGFVTAAAAVAVGMKVFGSCCQTACAQATSQPGDAAAAAPAGPVDVGAKADFAKDGPVLTWEKDNHLIVMKQGGKLYAMSSKCTHRGRDVEVQDDHFHCTWHNSMFGFDGVPTSGPATKAAGGGALQRYAITVNDAGHVIVDTSKKFDKDKWDDAASFVTV
jgi:nitrite reductase/ring-hydroxylating ferredoxin subunit